jgi:Uma2 family endonuclease
MMTLKQQYISAETFWELSQESEYAGKLLELIDGEIIEMSKPGGKHGVVTGNIFGFLWTYVRQNNLGYVTAAETGYILKKNLEGCDSIRGLDVGYIHKDRLPEGVPDKHIPIAPDLAVEVISPGNSAEDIHNKILELLNAGTKLIWIVYPESKTVNVHTKAGTKTFTIEDVLDGGAALPNFSLAIADIFR